MAFYNVKVQFEVDNGKKVSKKTEQYLVAAMSVTEAEANVIGSLGAASDYEVIGVTESRISKVIQAKQ